MILDDTSIREICEAGAIDPYDSRLVQPSSIDVRLGRSFLVPRLHGTAVIDMASIPPMEELSERIVVPLYRRTCDRCEGIGARKDLFGDRHECSCDGGYRYDDDGKFVIHPGECVLGSTLERIRIPDDMVGQLSGKSSIGRLFVIPHAEAGFFDAGWDGVGTLEIVNLSRVPVVLRPGMTFAQMKFIQMPRAASKPYSGRYQGATTVQGSRYAG